GRWMQLDPLGYVDGANGYEYEMNRPVAASDPLGLKWTNKELLDNLGKCDGGTGIYEKAKQANGGKDPTIIHGTPTSGFKAETDSPTGTITILPGLDVCEVTQILIHELTNLSHKKDFAELASDAFNGLYDRENYIRAAELLEYHGMKNVLQAFDACNKQWGCKTCIDEAFRPAKDFEDYYKNYLLPRHKDYWGKGWDDDYQGHYNWKPFWDRVWR